MPKKGEKKCKKYFQKYTECHRKNCALGVLVTEETIFVKFLL